MKTKFFGLLLCVAIVLQVVLVGAGPVPVKAADPPTWYVDAALGTDNSTQGTGPGSAAFKTISYAVADTRVANGDIVQVAAGEYTGPVSTTKSLTFRGAQAGVDARDRSGAESVWAYPSGLTVQSYALHAEPDTVSMTVDGFKFLGGPSCVVLEAHTVVFENNIVEANSNGWLPLPYLVKIADTGTDTVTIRFNDISPTAVPEYGGAVGCLLLKTSLSPGAVVIDSNRLHNAGSGGCGLTLNVGVNEGVIALTNNDVYGNAGDGLNLYQCKFTTLTATGNSFRDNLGSGVNLVSMGVGNYTPQALFNYNDIYGNAVYGMTNTAPEKITVDGRYNWWGDNSGPYNAAYNSSGLGNEVSANVLFIPWDGMPVPTVSSLSPVQGLPGQSLPGVVISGAYFSGATGVSLGPGITVSSPVVNSAGTQVTVDIIIDAGAAPGPRNVSVTTPAGTGVLSYGFAVLGVPTVSAVSPGEAAQGDTLPVTIAGTNLLGVSTVGFGPGITVSNVAVNSDGTQITADIAIDLEATLGARDVSATNAAGTGVLPDSFTVIPASEPPVAADNAYVTDYGTTLDVAAPGVLGNDWDPESDPMTAVLLSDVSHGTLTLNSDGSFVYTPDAGLEGIDTFTYRAFDGFGYSNAATVSITIDPESLRPVALNDSYTEPYNTTVSIAAPGVLGNDYDLQSDPLTAELVSGVSYGTLTFNPDGSFVYVPNWGFQGTDTFTYRAFDGTYYSDVATVYVTERPPLTPTLVSPDAVEVRTASVTFVWNGVIGAVDYMLVVSTSSNLANTASYKFAQKVGNVTTYTDDGYPRNGAYYYWWVYAFAEDGTYSPYTQVAANGKWFRSMPTVSAPTLVSPDIGAYVRTASVTFVWNAVENGVDYKLIVSSNSDMSKTAYYKFAQNVGNVTAYTDDGYPRNGTQYYWWVWAFGEDGTYSLYMQVVANGRWFRSMPTVDAPTLTSPEIGAELSTASVTFGWNVVENGVAYKLTVSTNSDLAKTAYYKFDQNVGNVTTYTDDGYARNGTKYYWWVWAFGEDGTYSLYMQVVANGRWFRSMPTVDAPTLVSPEIGAYVRTASVTFEWNALDNAVDYKLTVSTNSDISKTAYYKFNQDVGNVTSYTDDGYPRNGTKYYWWVWAFAEDGTYSPYAMVVANGRWFRSMPSVDAPTLISPVGGLRVASPSVTFLWNAVDNAVDYRLTVSTNSDINKTAYYKFNQNVGNVTTYTDYGYPQNGITYYWWVWAFGADGTFSPYSDVVANRGYFKSTLW